MVTLSTILVVFVSAVSVKAEEKLNPLSDEFIHLINSKQNSWKAGRNFPENTPQSYIENLMGALEDEHFDKLPKLYHDAELIANLPESFDPRDKWPNCLSLNEIRDQGSCSSCWAFAAVETMTDRYCIQSNGKHNFYFSAQDLLTCCMNCGSGCHGGIPRAAWEYWVQQGIVSGGNYNSNQGCRSYEIAECEHGVPGNLPPCNKSVDTPECVQSCISNYNTEYNNDKRQGKSVYAVPSDEDHIKAELFNNGPIEGVIQVYDDFITYKEGVYIHTEGSARNKHAVKMLGWGEQNGHKYWLMANSWNANWGDKGFFKIVRGEDHCGIESALVAGEPIV